MVEDLARSDRSPKELGEQFGLTSNLLAHHLGVLSEAGLIERIISSGDQRRRYIRLARAAIDYLGLRVTQPGGTVLFVCSHNSARSQLAAAMWRGRTGGQASSAGTDPADRVHPRAVTAAKRAGFDISKARPQLLGDTVADSVVTVCDRAHEELEPESHWLHWSLPDPVEIDTDAAFDHIVDLLNARISHLPED